MYALLECEVSKGLFPKQATVKVIAQEGVPEYMPVTRSVLKKMGKRYYLPVFLVESDEERQAMLVGLPVQADSGKRRLWVKFSSLRSLAGSSEDTVHEPI